MVSLAHEDLRLPRRGDEFRGGAWAAGGNVILSNRLSQAVSDPKSGRPLSPSQSGREGCGLLEAFGQRPSPLIPHWVSGSRGSANEGQMRWAVDFPPLGYVEFAHINTKKGSAFSSLLCLGPELDLFPWDRQGHGALAYALDGCGHVLFRLQHYRLVSLCPALMPHPGSHCLSSPQFFFLAGQ